MTARETRNHVLQRLQIGVIGIVAILSMVGLANLVLDRASNEAMVDGARSGQVQANQDASPPAEQNAEPLADLGVAPSIPAEQTISEPVHQQQSGAAPLNGTVPDLQKSPREPSGQ